MVLTLKDPLHICVGEKEAVYSTATAQNHLKMSSKHPGTGKKMCHSKNNVCILFVVMNLQS